MGELFDFVSEDWKQPSSPSTTECSSPVSSFSSDYTSLESIFSDGEDISDAARVDEVLLTLTEGVTYKPKPDSAKKRRAEAIERRNKRRGISRRENRGLETKSTSIYSTVKPNGVKGEVVVAAAERKEERLIKNRESAALSRLRKRQEMDELRRKVEELTAANSQLTNRVQELVQENEQLRAGSKIAPENTVETSLSFSAVLPWTEGQDDIDVLLEEFEFTESLQCSLESKALERLRLGRHNYKYASISVCQTITLSLKSEKLLFATCCELSPIKSDLYASLSNSSKYRAASSFNCFAPATGNRSSVSLINYLSTLSTMNELFLTISFHSSY